MSLTVTSGIQHDASMLLTPNHAVAGQSPVTLQCGLMALKKNPLPHKRFNHKRRRLGIVSGRLFLASVFNPSQEDLDKNPLTQDIEHGTPYNIEYKFYDSLHLAPNTGLVPSSA